MKNRTIGLILLFLGVILMVLVILAFGFAPVEGWRQWTALAILFVLAFALIMGGSDKMGQPF